MGEIGGALWTIRAWVKWRSNIISAVTAIYTGVAGFFTQHLGGWNSITLPIAVMLIVLAWYASDDSGNASPQFLNNRADRASAQNAMIRAAASRITKALLRQLLAWMNLASNVERVSVYYFSGNDQFVLASRYSAKPEYDRVNRQSYPADQGFIGGIWSSEGSTEIQRIRGDWVERAVKTGIPREVAQGISMKSNSYLLHRLEQDGRAVGVLVIESMDRQRITAEHVLQIKQSFLVEALSEAVSELVPVTHDLPHRSRARPGETEQWETAYTTHTVHATTRS